MVHNSDRGDSGNIIHYYEYYTLSLNFLTAVSVRVVYLSVVHLFTNSYELDRISDCSICL